YLPGRGRVRDRRPAELGDAAHLVLGLDDLDRYRVRVAGHRQRSRLADGRDERLQVRPRHRADVEPREHGVRELDETDPEAVAAVLRHVLDELRLDERRELTGDGARHGAGPPGDLVRPELALG